MNPLNLKAFFLSALVLPGLGQLYKGQKGKGVGLILLVNIFLLAGVWVLLKGAGQAILTARISGSIDASRIATILQQNSPAGRWLLGAFAVVWGFGAFDALCAKADPTGKPVP